MNLQTERMDNHKAQLTVEVESKQFEAAKRKAARRISRLVNIRGFRKGKAPYRLVAQRVGESAIIEEAVEELGNDVYRQAVAESDIDPYGPAALEDFTLEPAPTFTFSVSLQPEIDLKDFADVRVDYEAPVVTDEEVDAALEEMRRRAIEVLDDNLELAAAGNRVTVDVNSEFSDGEEADDDDEADGEDADDDETPTPKKGDSFLRQRDLTVILDVEEDPIMEGFVEALIGAELHEKGEFELTVPPDERYESVVGRKVKFDVEVKKIEAVRLPPLDDEFARKTGEKTGDDDIHDLESLRQSEREELEQDAVREARTAYSGQVLGKIIEGAEIAFPTEMLEECIDRLLDGFDQDLQRQGMNLETFIGVTGTTRETLREQYRERGIQFLKQNLTLRELAAVQDVQISEEQIEESLDGFVRRLGGSRDMFDTPRMREDLANRLFNDQMTTRLCAIGRGEDIEKALEEREAQVKADNEKMSQRMARIEARREAEEANEAADDDMAVETSVDGQRQITVSD